MSKYEALGQFLFHQTKTLVPMTFREIEKIIGDHLPASKRYPAWWSNNPSNNPMTKVWLDAGFTTEQVDTASGKVVFRKASKSLAVQPPKGRHPLIGCMKGTVTIAPGDDLSEAGSEWADYLDEVYGPDQRN